MTSIQYDLLLHCLQEACITSLDLKSEDARTYAEGFSWEAATDTFIEALERTSVTGNES